MGLFDPPTTSIARRLPVSVQPYIHEVQHFAENHISAAMAPTQRAASVAMVMGAWANAHARFGTFEISQRDLLYIQKIYENCARVAGPNTYLALAVIAAMFDADMMPMGMQNPFADSTGSAPQENGSLKVAPHGAAVTGRLDLGPPTLTDEELMTRQVELRRKLDAKRGE